MEQIFEWRGVEGLVAAEVLTDDNGESGYTTGEVFPVAGVAEISKETNSSNEAHFYDNIPAIIVSNIAEDTITVSASGIPLDVYAKLTGQKYDENTGAVIEGETVVRYFAIGYVTEKTNGDKVYVWRYKTRCSVPSVTNTTKNDGTDANGQELTFTGVYTTHKFVKNDNKGASALVVDVGKNLADVTNFFATVTTPDTLVPKTAYKLYLRPAVGTTISVKRNGVELANEADVYAGDQLQITGTGGVLEVNGNQFISGNIHVVTGDVNVYCNVV